MVRVILNIAVFACARMCMCVCAVAVRSKCKMFISCLATICHATQNKTTHAVVGGCTKCARRQNRNHSLARNVFGTWRTHNRIETSERASKQYTCVIYIYIHLRSFAYVYRSTWSTWSAVVDPSSNSRRCKARAKSTASRHSSWPPLMRTISLSLVRSPSAGRWHWASACAATARLSPLPAGVVLGSVSIVSVDRAASRAALYSAAACNRAPIVSMAFSLISSSVDFCNISKGLCDFALCRPVYL